MRQQAESSICGEMTENHSLQSHNGEGDGEENTEKDTKTSEWWPSLGQKQGIDRWPDAAPLVEESERAQDDSGAGPVRGTGDTKWGVTRTALLKDSV